MATRGVAYVDGRTVGRGAALQAASGDLRAGIEGSRGGASRLMRTDGRTGARV